MSRQITIASLVWGASILLSRLVGIVREGVVGRTLGVGHEADLYANAFSIPDFLNYLLAGGALSIVFIPIYGRHWARKDERAASESFQAVSSAVLALLLVGTTAVWFALPWLVPFFAPGFDDAARAELVRLSRIVLPAQIFHVLGGLLSAALQARDKHVLPALAPIVYAIVTILGGLMGQSIGGDVAGASGFAWGVLAGSALGPFLLPAIGCARMGLVWRPRFTLAQPDVRAYFVRSLPIMIGFSIVVVDDWYLKGLGTRLGEGAASSLAYGKTLMRVPLGVFGFAASLAAYPTLQRLVAEGRTAEMHATLERTARRVFLIACLAAAVVGATRVEVVSLVYGRTRLSADEVSRVAEILAIVLVALPAWSLQPLLARGFYALSDTWRPALLGTIIAGLAYPLYVVCGERLGVAGLALASSIAIVVYVVLLHVLLRSRLPASPAGNKRGAPFLLRALACGAVAFAAGEVTSRAWTIGESTIALLVHAGCSALVTTAVFVAAAWTLRLHEARTAWEHVRGRLGQA